MSDHTPPELGPRLAGDIAQTAAGPEPEDDRGAAPATRDDAARPNPTGSGGGVPTAAGGKPPENGGSTTGRRPSTASSPGVSGNPGAAAVSGPAADAARRAGRLLAALLAATVLLLLAGVLWWRLVPDAPPPPPLPPPGAPPPGGMSLEGAVALAQAQADRWLPGARLLNATMQVDWPWQVPPGQVRSVPPTGWVTAVFLAPWDAPPGRNETGASLSLVVERLSGQIVQQETLGWEHAPLPSATPAPGIDSAVAGLLAERAGGTAFRRACPDLRHLSRIGLVATFPGFPPHWLVTYEDAREPARFGLLLRIDARSGDVLDRRQDAPSCPGEADG